MGRNLLKNEIINIKTRFFALLDVELQKFNPKTLVVDGAYEIIAALLDDNWRVGFATGSWHDSAMRKLQVTGLDGFNIPLVASDRSPNRAELIRITLREINVSAKAPTIYVGDQVWDFEASKQVGCGFLGRGNEIEAKPLLKAGATAVVETFTPMIEIKRLMKTLAR